MKNYIAFSFVILLLNVGFSQSNSKTNAKKTTVNKTATKKTLTSKTEKLPTQIFLDIINTTQSFVINHQTKFEHVDVPKSKYNLFLSYIKDSAVAEIPTAKTLVYYGFTLQNGKIINGDIYWNDTKSYIVFKVDDKRYVNYFTKDGATQLKTIFKL